jgi:hypothetical protein
MPWCGCPSRFAVIAVRPRTPTQEALTRVYLRWSRLGDPLPYARRAVVNPSPAFN